MGAVEESVARERRDLSIFDYLLCVLCLCFVAFDMIITMTMMPSSDSQPDLISALLLVVLDRYCTTALPTETRCFVGQQCCRILRHCCFRFAFAFFDLDFGRDLSST